MVAEQLGHLCFGLNTVSTGTVVHDINATGITASDGSRETGETIAELHKAKVKYEELSADVTNIHQFVRDQEGTLM